MASSALQDLQGEVESFYLTVTSDHLSWIRSFPPEIAAAVMSDLWPSTVYRVSLQASNGAHNTSEAALNVTTEDGGTCVMALWGSGVGVEGGGGATGGKGGPVHDVDSIHLREFVHVGLVRNLLNTSCKA